MCQPTIFLTAFSNFFGGGVGWVDVCSSTNTNTNCHNNTHVCKTLLDFSIEIKHYFNNFIYIIKHWHILALQNYSEFFKQHRFLQIQKWKILWVASLHPLPLSLFLTVWVCVGVGVCLLWKELEQASTRTIFLPTFPISFWMGRWVARCGFEYYIASVKHQNYFADA